MSSQVAAAEALAIEFPLLWEKAQQFDFAQRLGGCTDPLLREIDQALHELWLARSEQARRKAEDPEAPKGKGS